MNENGNILVIGASHNADGGISGGHVRTYQWQDNLDTWVLMTPDIDGNILDRSSVSLSADGLRVAVGSVGDIANKDPSQTSGRVRVYEFVAIEQ